jgi:hypothetical protein
LNIHKGFCWYYQSLLSAGIVETFLQVNAQFPDFRIIVTGASCSTSGSHPDLSTRP